MTPVQTIRLLTLGSCVLILLIGFANCGKFSALPDSGKRLDSASCSAKAIQQIRQSTKLAVDVNCEDSSQYSCSHRIFRPNINTGHIETEECLQSLTEPSPELCLQVKEFRFDTAPASHLENINPLALAEGGEFNHEIYECYNTHVQRNGVLLIVAEGTTLEVAWQGAQKQCSERTHHDK